MASSLFSHLTDPEIRALRELPDARRGRRTTLWAVLFPVIMLSLFFGLDLIITREYAELNRYVQGMNTASRQSLLSERIAFQSNMMTMSDSPSVHFEASQELYRAARDMRTERAAARLELMPLPDPLMRLYEQAPTMLDQRVHDYTESAITLSRVSFTALSIENEHYQAVSQAANRLYTDLSSAQNLYQVMIEQTSTRITEMNRGRTFSLMLAFLLVGVFVIRPGIQGIWRYIYILYGRIVSLRRTLNVMEQRQHAQEALIESLPVAVGLFDAETGQTLHMNQRFLSLLGHEGGTLNTPELYSLQSFIHPEDTQRALGCAQKAAKTGQPALGEYRMCRKDGSYVRVESRAIAVQQSRENIGQAQLLTLIRDLNEPVIALREPLEIPRPLLDAMSAITYETVFVYDLTHTRLIYVSPSIAQLVGYSPSELEGDMEIARRGFVHPDDEKAYLIRVKNYILLSDDETQEDVVRVRHKDGTWHQIYIRAQVLLRTADGTPQSLIGMCSDLTVKSLSNFDRGETAF